MLAALKNTTLTENQAITNKSTGNPVLDFYYHVPARRGQDNSQLFFNAFAQDELLTLKALFYLRDIRGGKGERETFRQLLRLLAFERPNLVINLIPLVPEFGRFDDLWILFDTPVEKDMISFVKQRFYSDLREIDYNI